MTNKCREFTVADLVQGELLRDPVAKTTADRVHCPKLGEEVHRCATTK